MALNQNDRALLNELVESPNVTFTAEDRAAVERAGIPIGCLIKCATDLAKCDDPKSPKCIVQFVGCVVDCFV